MPDAEVRYAIANTRYVFFQRDRLTQLTFIINSDLTNH